MRQLLAWVFVSFGVGTMVALVRYLAVWYILRRVRRLFRRKSYDTSRTVDA
jgi:hypothetical protein